MTDTIQFIGCGMADEVYETDAEIAGHAIMWNVSRLQRAAERGEFGPPILRPMSVLPPMSAIHTLNIDWHKVTRFMLLPHVLARPALCLDCEADSARHIINGNHRIAARRQRGMTDFETYVVPMEVERQFRVTIIADGKPISWSDLEA